MVLLAIITSRAGGCRRLAASPIKAASFAGVAPAIVVTRNATSCTMRANATAKPCVARVCRSSYQEYRDDPRFFRMVPAVDDAMKCAARRAPAFKRAFADPTGRVLTDRPRPHKVLETRRIAATTPRRRP